MILVDTNIWLIAADRRASDHEVILGLLATDQDWRSPTPVIAESAWLILDRLGPTAHAKFLALVTSRQLKPVELNDEDWRRCLELATTYADMSLDLADASLVAVAERLGEVQIATLNYRDFRVIRPKHCQAFELLP